MSEHGSHSIFRTLAEFAPTFEHVFFIDTAELVLCIGVLYDFAAYIDINFCATVSETPTTTTTIIIMSAEGLPTGLLGAKPDADFIDNYEMLTGDDSQYTLSEKWCTIAAVPSCQSTGLHARPSLHLPPGRE
jgi:hypothetical protein